MSGIAIKNWEETFINWAKPLGETEAQRCENAEKMIKDTIQADLMLNQRRIKVFAQGSYANNTNVRSESDVDICARLDSTFYYRLPAGDSPEKYGIITPGIHDAVTFKNEVKAALDRRFGPYSVKRGDKAINVKENSYRVSVDVLPALEYRVYTGNFDSIGNPLFHRGIQSITDNGQWIINWPEQNCENGVIKNNETNQRYKKVVRIIKKLSYKMEDEGHSIAGKVKSFMIECLVWNVSNGILTSRDSLEDTIKEVLRELYHASKSENGMCRCSFWMEVNNLKPIFEGPKKCTVEEVNAFILTAWQYLGFVN